MFASDFAKLLGGVPGGKRQGDVPPRDSTAMTITATPATLFKDFAEGLLALGDVIRRNIIFTDTASGSATKERARRSISWLGVTAQRRSFAQMAALRLRTTW